MSIFGITVNGVEKCPLKCGANWHGLPKPAASGREPCPGPWGMPAPIVELEPEEMFVL